VNLAILAPAGGRKTQKIIDMCADVAAPRKRAVITFTTSAQKILIDRLLASDARSQMPTVMGWYTFLLDHIVRPYAPSVTELQGSRVKGLAWVDGTLPWNLPGVNFYLNSAGDVYSERLGLLASKTLEAVGESVIDRLERIFDEIYIDEVQDLRGNDLNVLNALLRSKIRVVLVGDVRQRLLSTSKSSKKNKKYDGLGLADWFHEMDKKKLLDLQTIQETWRCCPEVIQFADQMFTSGRFPPTESKVTVPDGMHHGVWVVEEPHIEEYIRRFRPACYRDSVRTKLVGTDSAMNFGLCKGATEEHVLIFPTEPMKKFWKDKTNNLADKSRMNAYVAITRARWSVAIYVDSARGYDIPVWKPNLK
jgi:hypothetical protein